MGSFIAKDRDDNQVAAADRCHVLGGGPVLGRTWGSKEGEETLAAVAANGWRILFTESSNKAALLLLRADGAGAGRGAAGPRGRANRVSGSRWSSVHVTLSLSMAPKSMLHLPICLALLLEI